MDKKLQRLETFRVQDMHGATYKVHAYEHLTRVHHFLDMETQWEPIGLIEYKLSTGEHLELDDDGNMYTAGSTMPLHRMQPVAHMQ
jgi:hypothetical protein